MPTPPKVFTLTITTLPEAEDAVGELLLRLSGQPPVATHDRIRGVSRVCVYLQKPAFLTPATRKALRQGLAAIRACGLDVGSARVSWNLVKAADWTESWKRHFKPMLVGRTLWIRPSWSRQRPGPGQSELVLDPGLSFGTGQHPTTGFCLAEIVRLRPRKSPASMLDVGTGSGILALAAARLGYQPVHGFDFDPESIRVARRNAADNHLDSQVRLVRSDVARLNSSPRRRYTVVAANLTSDLLLRHADALLAQVAPGGTLILAGILAEEFTQVAKAFESRGAQPLRSRRLREWCSGSFLIPACPKT